MRYFSFILSVALIVAAVNCEETENVDEDIPKEVCAMNIFGFFS